MSIFFMILPCRMDKKVVHPAGFEPATLSTANRDTTLSEPHTFGILKIYLDVLCKIRVKMYKKYV